MKWMLSFVLALVFTTGFAQKWEVYTNLYSGVHFFRGSGSGSNSWLALHTPTDTKGYLTDPFGKKTGFNYAAEIQVQKLTKGKLIWGSSLAFESLASQVAIQYMHPAPYASALNPVSGTGVLRNNFITLTPFVGKRLLLGKSFFDVSVGSDLGLLLESKESGKATGTGKTFTVQLTDRRTRLDIRPRLQIKVQLHQFGIAAGYSLGIRNYLDYDKVYSNFARLGLSYRLM